MGYRQKPPRQKPPRHKPPRQKPPRHKPPRQKPPRQKPTEYATKAIPNNLININIHICQGYVFI